MRVLLQLFQKRLKKWQDDQNHTKPRYYIQVGNHISNN